MTKHDPRQRPEEGEAGGQEGKLGARLLFEWALT